MNDTYSQRAQRHRPTDQHMLAIEARRLRDIHQLQPANVAHILRLDVVAVMQMLGSQET